MPFLQWTYYYQIYFYYNNIIIKYIFITRQYSEINFIFWGVFMPLKKDHLPNFIQDWSGENKKVLKASLSGIRENKSSREPREFRNGSYNVI